MLEDLATIAEGEEDTTPHLVMHAAKMHATPPEIVVSTKWEKNSRKQGDLEARRGSKTPIQQLITTRPRVCLDDALGSRCLLGSRSWP